MKIRFPLAGLALMCLLVPPALAAALLEGRLKRLE